MKNSPLRKALEDAARAAGIDLECKSAFGPLYNINYVWDINPDAINGDAWLENRTSFIHEIGVLSLIDSNKCDFIHVFFGQRRSPSHEPEVIGRMYWRDGENDDPARTLKRVRDLLATVAPVFQVD